MTVPPITSTKLTRETLLTKDGERTEVHPNAFNIHQPLIEDFARAVLENRDPVVTGEIGRSVASIEQEIYK